jgi:hypothetical protein
MIFLDFGTLHFPFEIPLPKLRKYFGAETWFWSRFWAGQELR